MEKEEYPLEGLPEHMKEFLKSIPKRKKPGRNDPCPCGSGKKHKICCIGKSFKEMDEIYHKRVKDELIQDFKKRVKDDTFAILDLDKYMVSISSSYGSYLTKEWGLYFSRNKIKMDDKKFQELFSKIADFLHYLPFIVLRTNKILDQNTMKVEEYEILFMAFKKEYVLEVLEKTDFPVSNTLDILYVLCGDVAYKIFKFLEKEGYSASYPHPVEDIENSEQQYMEEMSRQFFIALRSTQKMLYMTTMLKEIKGKCESPFEIELGVKLAEENIPFVQQLSINEDFPSESGKHTFTKPDFLILSPLEPIAIYCDGYAYHEKTPEQATHDKRIDRKLQEMGFVVLRFKGIEIKNNLDRCI